jgi:hypothetical protein
VAVNSALNSWRTGYNRNCLGLVDALAAEGRIKVLDRIYDFTNRMVPNPTVPSTYLRIVPNRA